MTSLAATLHTSALPARIVAAWNAAAARWNPVGVIVIAWAVLSVPLVFFRGYTAHEGLAVSIARTALETGDWLTPHMYNVRFVERPTLQSWIIAAISAPFGDVNQITARLPSVLFLLLGCALIYWLLRRVAASVPAALLGVALFLACPLVMRSYVMITADLPLAVLLFLAFALWWSGYAKERSASAAGWRLAWCWRCRIAEGAAADRLFRARRRPLYCRLTLLATNSRTGAGRIDLRGATRGLVRPDVHTGR